jgi:hypothetical protein
MAHDLNDGRTQDARPWDGTLILPSG